MVTNWTYKSSTGEMFRADSLWPVWVGYSGHESGRNDPDFEGVHDLGPIPRGTYTFGEHEDHPQLGPWAIPLTPRPNTNTFGRSGFYLHGDDAEHNASLGCIVRSPKSDRMIFNAGDQLNVV